MQLSYRFQFTKSTWGISIKLAAEDLVYTECLDCDQITDRIFLRISSAFKITDAEKSYAIKAIERMASLIHGNLPLSKK